MKTRMLKVNRSVRRGRKKKGSKKKEKLTFITSSQELFNGRRRK